jgi:hypothetical protein
VAVALVAGEEDGERGMNGPAAVERTIDPAFHLLPEDQIKRVFSQDMCDIDREFLGFTDVYFALARIIPTHWTIVDLGCAFSPQAFIFKDHAAYVGVDVGKDKERFAAPNTTHYVMTIGEFLSRHAADFKSETTFAICSYVPPWYREDPRELARQHFENVFTYYPAGTSLNPYRKPWPTKQT